MKKRSLFILCLCLIVSGMTFAQATKTITNSDLEKFRQKRLQAERDYLENYEKLGFPSPKELEQQREQSLAENEEAIIRQKEARLQNESDFAEQAKILRSEIASIEAQINYVSSQYTANQSSNGYFTGGVTRYGQSNSIWRGDATGRVFHSGRFGRFGRGGYGSYNRTSPFGSRYGQVFGSRSGASIRIGAQNGRWSGYNGYNYRQSKKYGYNRYNRNRYNGYYLPYMSGGNASNTEDDLTAQLRELQQARAGLYAEWQLLAEEARRAGVKID